MKERETEDAGGLWYLDARVAVVSILGVDEPSPSPEMSTTSTFRSSEVDPARREAPTTVVPDDIDAMLVGVESRWGGRVSGSRDSSASATSDGNASGRFK